MATKQPADKAPAGATATYEVVSRLDFNGETFEAGTTVELTQKEAEPLLGHTVKAK